MDDREFERLLDVLKDMNRNLERGLERISHQIEKLRD